MISDSRRGQHGDTTRSDLALRLLVRTDPELVALAAAVNAGIAGHETVAQITSRCRQRLIDDNLVRAFLRAAKLEELIRRAGNFGRYHDRMQALSVELGRSAYTHRRGPARTCADDLLEDDEDTVDLSDYIRGQGGF